MKISLLRGRFEFFSAATTVLWQGARELTDRAELRRGECQHHLKPRPDTFSLSIPERHHEVSAVIATESLQPRNGVRTLATDLRTEKGIYSKI